MIRTRSTLLFLSIGLLAAVSANAAEDGKDNYFGAGMGVSTISGGGSSAGGLGFDLIGGHKFNSYLGAEAGLSGWSAGSLTAVQANVSAVAMLPFGESGYQLYGKYGINAANVGTTTTTTSGTGSIMGVGVAYTKNSVSFRLGVDKADYGSFLPGYTAQNVGVQFLGYF